VLERERTPASPRGCAHSPGAHRLHRAPPAAARAVVPRARGDRFRQALLKYALRVAKRHGVGSLRAGKRATAVMSLLHSARMNGHEPDAYLKDVLERLPK
jgi:GNAT superfamily N-acetyltransferase